LLQLLVLNSMVAHAPQSPVEQRTMETSAQVTASADFRAMHDVRRSAVTSKNATAIQNYFLSGVDLVSPLTPPPRAQEGALPQVVASLPPGSKHNQLSSPLSAKKYAL
jgi:hypothetical protein